MACASGRVTNSPVSVTNVAGLPQIPSEIDGWRLTGPGGTHDSRSQGGFRSVLLSVERLCWILATILAKPTLCVWDASPMRLVRIHAPRFSREIYTLRDTEPYPCGSAFRLRISGQVANHLSIINMYCAHGNASMSRLQSNRHGCVRLSIDDCL